MRNPLSMIGSLAFSLPVALLLPPEAPREAPRETAA